MILWTLCISLLWLNFKSNIWHIFLKSTREQWHAVNTDHLKLGFYFDSYLHLWVNRNMERRLTEKIDLVIQPRTWATKRQPDREKKPVQVRDATCERGKNWIYFFFCFYMLTWLTGNYILLKLDKRFRLKQVKFSG